MDIDAALKDGYSLAEVNAEAARRTGFNYSSALNDGYTDEDINGELRKRLKSSQPKQASWGTAFKQKLAEAGNAADAAISLPAGALASVFSQEEGDKVFREMEARRKANLLGANPNQDELSTTQGVVGAIGTFPAQLLGAPGAAAEKGMDFINRGEKLSSAIPATAAEAALSAAGLGPMKAAGTFLGRAAIGAGANMATGAGSDAIAQLLADKQSTKEAYDPYNVEKRLQEGLVGGVLQGALGERPKAKTRLGTIKEQQAAVEASKPLPEAIKPVDEPLVDLKPSLRKSKEAYEAAVRERKLREESAFSPETEAQRALEEQQGLQQMGELKGALDSFDQLGKDRAAGKRQASAQEALNRRDMEMQDAVNQRTSLEQQAAERARQENAPTGAAEAQAKLDEVTQQQQAYAQHIESLNIQIEAAKAKAERLMKNSKAERAAQELINQRQSELELAVKQRTRLEMEAAERKRQLEASTTSPERAALLTEQERVRQLAEESRINKDSERMGNAQQMLIDDTQHVLPDSNQVIAPQYGAMRGAGRFDEVSQLQRNGGTTSSSLPIRADLSMEAANLENPLQRNLWGDELPQKSEQENPTSLTASIDATPSQPWKGDLRDQQIGRLNPEHPYAGKIIEMNSGIPFKLEDIKRIVSDVKEMGGFVKGLLETGHNTYMKAAAKAKEILGKAWDSAKAMFKSAWDTAIKNASSTHQNKELGGVLFDWGKKEKSADELRRLIDVVGDRYVRGEISSSQWRDALEPLNAQMVDALRLEQKFKEGTPAKEVAEVFPGYTQIPVGTKILTDRGMGTVVFNTDVRVGDTAYSLPRVDYGDGKARRTTSGDIKQVFGGPTKPITKSNFKKQGGGLLIDWGSSKKEQASLENAADVADEALIPKNPNAAEVVKKALAEGKDGKFLTYVQSGATSTAMKTGSAAIKAAAEIVQNAGKRAELAIRNIVSPAETALRKLSSKEITELADVFKDEMFSNRRFDADVLSSNLSVKQLEAYTNMREMFDKALDAQNAERVLKGMKPITASEAYMSSRWSGDFRRPIYEAVFNKDGSPKLDKDGKQEQRIVWYLASNSKRGLESQTKALLNKFPALKFDPKKDHSVSSGHNKTDLQSMYTTMLDILDRDDPAIQRIQQAIEEQTIAEGESTLGQEKHFKSKGNIRGFLGDRPGNRFEYKDTGVTFERSPKSEAIAMFHEQLQYAKNALTWSEMQTAANDIKGIISDPDLKAQQPHNVNYIREYFKNAIGHGEAKAIRALSDDIRTGLGVSPKVFDEAIGNVKSFFILQKLAASVGFTLANVVQTTNVLPYLMDLRSQGYKGNPVTAIGVGFPAGLMMAVSHYIASKGGSYVNTLPGKFYKDAIRYAEANGVTSRSVYDESPLETGFSPIKRVVNFASKSMSIPETFVRSVAFMTYAQMLKDSGKYTDQSKLFQHAEELVNASMVDYRNTEKPLAFSKGGTMGNFLNTLQTYPISFYNQYGYMARRASEGNKIPLMTMVSLQAAMGGAGAIAYSEDLYRFFTWYKNNLASDSQWKAMQESPFLSDPKLWLMETLGKGSVYGYVSDKTGLGLSSRISAPAMSEMFQSPIGPAVDIAGQVGALGKAVLDPTNSTKWAQSAMKSVPVGLAGLLESSDIMKDHTYTERPDGSRVYVKNTDLAARVATIKRSPEEDAVRRFGLRSQREVVEKDVQYITGQQNRAVKERIGGASGGAGELMEKFYDATRRGDKETAQRLATLYTQLSGKAINEEMVKRQVIQERMTALERTKKGMDKLGPQELINNARMLSILQDNK